MKTKISSAAIPRTMKTTSICKLLKYVTPKIPFVINKVNGKLKRMMEIPIKLKKIEFKWKIM